MENRADNVIGILGGMGPLASAEFIKTIYEYNLGEREQESPVVMMYSDPTFPDRTEAFLAGSSDVLLDRLTEGLLRLFDLGASRAVICCMTIHHLVPSLPQEIRKRVISLVDVLFDSVAQSQKKHLLICSSGTRTMRIMQSHSQWELFKDRIILPDESDQSVIHRDLIYPIKKNPDIRTLFPLLESLLAKYQVDSFIVGCSEIHLLAKHFVSSNDQKIYGCIDPLAIIARELMEECK